MIAPHPPQPKISAARSWASCAAATCRSRSSSTRPMASHAARMGRSRRKPPSVSATSLRRRPCPRTLSRVPRVTLPAAPVQCAPQADHARPTPTGVPRHGLPSCTLLPGTPTGVPRRGLPPLALLPARPPASRAAVSRRWRSSLARPRQPAPRSPAAGALPRHVAKLPVQGRPREPAFPLEEPFVNLPKDDAAFACSESGQPPRLGSKTQSPSLLPSRLTPGRAPSRETALLPVAASCLIGSALFI